MTTTRANRFSGTQEKFEPSMLPNAEEATKVLKKHFFETIGKVELLQPTTDPVTGEEKLPYTFFARANELLGLKEALKTTMNNMEEKLKEENLSEAVRTQIMTSIVDLTDTYQGTDITTIKEMKKYYKKNASLGVYQATHNYAILGGPTEEFADKDIIVTFYNELSRSSELLKELNTLVQAGNLRPIINFIKKHVEVVSIAVVAHENPTDTPVFALLTEK